MKPMKNSEVIEVSLQDLIQTLEDGKEGFGSQPMQSTIPT